MQNNLNSGKHSEYVICMKRYFFYLFLIKKKNKLKQLLYSFYFNSKKQIEISSCINQTLYLKHFLPLIRRIIQIHQVCYHFIRYCTYLCTVQANEITCFYFENPSTNLFRFRQNSVKYGEGGGLRYFAGFVRTLRLPLGIKGVRSIINAGLFE